jgi:hypothetical protein
MTLSGNQNRPLPKQRVSVRIPTPCWAILAFAWATGAVWAQAGSGPGSPTTPDINVPAALPLAGPQILSVSAYAAYYSNGSAGTGGFQAGSANLPYDVGLGGSILFGWSKFTERTTFALSYTPSYTAQIRYSSLDALNHAFSLNVSRKLTPRWTLGFSVTANYSTLEESLFAPTTLSSVSAVPASFGQLSGALLSGNFTGNQQLGVALTNSPLVQSPVANLLYGQRMFTASGQSTLSYALSPRLSVTFRGGGNRTQPVAQSQTATSTTAAVLPNTTSGTASVALSYSLSPVSQIGGTVTTTRVSSSLEDAYTTTSLATFGRTLGSQWIIQLHGGVGFTNVVGQSSLAVGQPSSGIATKPLPAAGGSLVYKTISHTFLGSIDRTVSDSYGLGASSTSTATVTWRWHPPGSYWSLQSGLSWQQLQGGALANTTGWRATAGVNRAFGLHVSALWQYTYLNYSGGLQTSASSFSDSAVRVSLFWTPHPNLPR